MDNLLFLDLPLWVFPILHISFAVLVLGTFVLAPPRMKRRTVNRLSAAAKSGS